MKASTLKPPVLLSYFSAIVFVLPMLVSSCSKSSPSPQKENTTGGEMPFQAAVHDATLINGKTPYGQYGGAEIGYRVHFTIGGIITQLGANMASPGKYIVSFWRTADSHLLGQVTVNNADTSKFAYAAITPISVKPDTAYTVSIHVPDGSTNNHWIYTWSPVRDLYPFTQGHVVADQVLEKAYLPVNTASVYPYDYYPSDQRYIGSSCDFVFVPSK